jgi:Holliday junction resolvase RusA-like endonuclease
MPTLRFEIPGPPVGAPRMTQKDRWVKRPRVERYRTWKDVARLYAGRLPAVENILSVSWVAYFEPPKSWSKKESEAALGQLHRSKPDRDNIDKALLDALFHEDQGVAKGSLEKRWGSPARMEVVIEYEVPNG